MRSPPAFRAGRLDTRAALRHLLCRSASCTAREAGWVLSAEDDGNRMRNAHHDAVDLRGLRGRIEPKIGQTVENRIERARHFHTREMLTNAHVRTVGEREMPMDRLAMDV